MMRVFLNGPTLDFDFQTNFHDLGCRDPEVCRWKIGVEMHRCEQGLSPTCHASRHTPWDHHHTPEIVGDVPRIDAA
jgi:hypothetical protein